MPDHIRDALIRVGNTIRRAARDLLHRLANHLDPDPEKPRIEIHFDHPHNGPGYGPGYGPNNADLKAMRELHRRARRAGYSAQPDDFYRNR